MLSHNRYNFYTLENKEVGLFGEIILVTPIALLVKNLLEEKALEIRRHRSEHELELARAVDGHPPS